MPPKRLQPKQAQGGSFGVVVGAGITEKAVASPWGHHQPPFQASALLVLPGYCVSRSGCTRRGDGPLGIRQGGLGGYRIPVLPPGRQPDCAVAPVQPWGGALKDRPRCAANHSAQTPQGAPATQQGLLVVWARSRWNLNPLGANTQGRAASQTIVKARPYANRAIVTKPEAP